VGTRSIEKSEQISGILRRKGIPHNVLNAKYHEQEASIIVITFEGQTYAFDKTIKTNGENTEFPTRKFDPPKNRRVNFMPVKPTLPEVHAPHRLRIRRNCRSQFHQPHSVGQP